ncbi:ABC transporter substrate-binding protein [Bradyrhizobium sp. SYSU BS000235]|uniref:ABC transporter substrate-binding protein n=1 Tax=Bradyrhizobium sp. SYSU BS000235 TaxID=3411332 RepID=UPI003C77D9D1
MRFLKALLVGLSTAVAVQFGAAASAQQPVKFHALLPIPNFDESFAPVAVALQLGYFKQEGLDVTITAVNGSKEVAIQVSAGNADAGLASPADAIIGMQTGKDLNVQYYSNLYYRNIWPISVVDNSPITSVKELKGKKIGVLSMGSTGITFGRAYVKDAGLNPQTDVSFIPIGAGAQALTAIRQGVVQALVFNDSALAKFGVLGLKTRLLSVSDEMQNLPDTSILARPENLKSKRAQYVGFARAIAKGYLFTITNPLAAVKLTWQLKPEAQPKNMSPEEALKQGVAVTEARMAIWSSPKTNGVSGAFVDSDWKNLVAFLKDDGSLQEDVPLSRIYTNALSADINQFDKQAIIKQATEFTFPSSK